MSSCNRSSNPTRREALKRLGLAVTAAYVAPSVLLVSEARAATSGISDPSAPTTTSPVTPPTPPTAPSNIEQIEADVTETDTCRSRRSASPDAPFISASDFNRAQEAVDAGYAKPLDAIWSTFIEEYPGQVISIEFTGYRWRPRFRFKAISASGRLETVIVSARTGEIEKIVGC